MELHGFLILVCRLKFGCLANLADIASEKRDIYDLKGPFLKR